MLNFLRIKKSQVTAVVIVAFVVLIVFMLLLFSVKSINSLKVRSEAKKALNNFFETSTIQQYTLSCIDSVLNDGLQKITLQGGRIYDYQFPPSDNRGINTSSFVQGQDFLELNVSSLLLNKNPYENDSLLMNISYGLLTSKNSDETHYLESSSFNPPMYPIYLRTLEDINGFSNFLDPFFVPAVEGLYGESHLSPLCDKFIDCTYDSLISSNFDNNISMQKQLEKYLEVNVRDCVNFSYFEKLTPYNITDSNITANVQFAVDQINVVLDYPLSISVSGRQPVTEILTFNKEKNYRLSKVYNLAHTMIKYDSFDLFFGPLQYPDIYGLSSYFSCRMTDRTRCYDNSISVHKFENFVNTDETKYDDLIVIIDNASQTNGNPLIFQYFIENRRPALDYIHEYPRPDLDIVVFENQTIDLNPFAYDPDDNLIQKYKYSGWREDYYTWFNKTKWFEDSGWNHPENFNNYLITYETDPQNWTSSQIYTDTQQNASYDIQYGELGFHNVTITIWDEEGLKDWQVIKILVQDLPKAIANASNNYSDIPDLEASVEDPYILDGSLSYAIIGSLTEDNWFIWREQKENIEIKSKNKIETLPFAIVFDIHNIPPYHFNSSFLELGTENRSIKLTIGTLLPNGQMLEGEPDYLSVEVHECLPHATNDNIPHPYSDEVFQAAHVCCNNGTDDTWGTVKDFGDPCFTKVEYSSLKYFEEHKTDWYNATYLASGSPGETPGLATFSNVVDKQNDIFERTFTRECDGSRGNICNGSGEAEFDNVVVCDDVLLFDQDYRCYGPPENYFDDKIENNIINCVVYDSPHNFEELNDDLIVETACRFNVNAGACYYKGVAMDNNPVNLGNGGTATNVQDDNGAALSPIYCKKVYCDGESLNINTKNCGFLKDDDDCFCSAKCMPAVANPIGVTSCEGKDPGYVWGKQSSNEYRYGCPLDCVAKDCNPFIFENLDCKDRCDIDSDCTDNYLCDESENDCIKCGLDGTQLTQTFNSNINKCEEDCGAASKCDEKAPNSPINVTHECSNTCGAILIIPAP